MNKPTPFQKYLLEQARRLGSSGISKGTPKLPRPTLQPREVPFRSGDDDDFVGPPAPPSTQLEPSDWWGTPEEQSQYLIDFINSLVFYDMNGDPIDMNEYLGEVADMLFDWVEEMIEDGIDEFDDNGIEDIPNTEDLFDGMTPYMRYTMLQKLKDLYDFLHGFIEDLEAAG